MFGWPSDDKAGGEKVVLALTFASIPKAGVFDTDRRIEWPDNEDHSLEAFLKYAEAIKDKYLKLKASEIRVTFDRQNRAKVDFIDFPSAISRRSSRPIRSRPSRRPTGIRSRPTSAAAMTRFSTTCRGFSARSITRRSSTTSRSR